jgi:hypothetical protein
MLRLRHLIGLLYVSTALVGFYWSIYLTLTGLYGIPFSAWYFVILIGALILFVGAVFWWASTSEWTRWLPIVGSTLLASYFVPAVTVLARQGRVDAIRALIVALVLTSLAIAIKERHTFTSPQPPQQKAA